MSELIVLFSHFVMLMRILIKNPDPNSIPRCVQVNWHTQIWISERLQSPFPVPMMNMNMCAELIPVCLDVYVQHRLPMLLIPWLYQLDV